jgi:hypothetical protein
LTSAQKLLETPQRASSEQPTLPKLPAQNSRSDLNLESAWQFIDRIGGIGNTTAPYIRSFATTLTSAVPLPLMTFRK